MCLLIFLANPGPTTSDLHRRLSQPFSTRSVEASVFLRLDKPLKDRGNTLVAVQPWTPNLILPVVRTGSRLAGWKGVECGQSRQPRSIRCPYFSASAPLGRL